MDNRIVDLETRLAFQEDAIQQLSDVLADQQREIAGLVRDLQVMQVQLRQAMPADVAPQAEETPPPHY